MRAGDFGVAVGYGEDLVYKVEGGKRSGALISGVAGVLGATAGRNMIREAEPVWFKSSYSGGNDDNSCVELALTPGTVHVRDSKTTDGSRLALTPETWSDFVPYASAS